MTKLKLNFSKLEQQRRQRRQAVVLLLLCIILALVISEYFKTQRQIAALQQTQSSLVSDTAKSNLSRAMQQKMEKLHDVITELNVPWQALFLAIENIKKDNPDVLLKRLEPNLLKGEISIQGEVAHLDDLLQFIDSFNQQRIFKQALLINQQRLEQTDGMSFNLKVRWLPHE